jgi:membrane protein DedA with SNARE-associated domain
MFNIPDSLDLGHIKTIGYPLMLLVMILEGPVATLLAAFAASLGFFNIYLVFILSMLGDITGDIILYIIGYTGGARALAKAENILKIKPALVIKMEKLFQNHGKKTIFAVKSTTGLCWITFIAAGAMRMNFHKFLWGSFWGGIIWSTFLIIAGYFFGYAFETINEYIKYAGFIILIAVIVFYASITYYKKCRSRDILQ